MLKVLFVFGTRPEAIKIAPVIIELRKRKDVEAIVCVTAQHREMLDNVMSIFGLRADYDLDVMRPRQSLAITTSSILDRLTPVVSDIRPDRIVVHGDTATAFAASLTGFYCGVPVGHVEAGLRTGNMHAPWPEEFNRRAIDMVADLLWAPTEPAAAALQNEGVAASNIFVTGNTGVDALLLVSQQLRNDVSLTNTLLSKLPKFDRSRKLILITSHRRESHGAGLTNICQAVARIARRGDVEIVWPVHPNPTVVETVNEHLRGRDNIFIIPHCDYLTFSVLMNKSYLIITDSGGIQEEAPSLSKPVLVTRNETERKEALDAGTALLVGTSPDRIEEAVASLLDCPDTYSRMSSARNPFGDGRAALRIVETLATRHGLRVEPRSTD